MSFISRRKKSMNIFKILLKIPVPWVYVLVYLISLIPQLLIPVHINGELTIIIIKIAGALFFVTGAFFAAWSLLIFHRARTTTTPGESSARLVGSGPYRFTRNPMYVSLFIAYLGEAGMLVQVWPVIFLPVVFLYVNYIVIPLEEERLKTDFRDAYKDYCMKVRRWL
jgi:protein-S-isoprenylcysteine O-methyltransferase Ste14